jgi:hypothetical protein
MSYSEHIEITRDEAIERIKKIALLFIEKKYQEIKEESNEIEECVVNAVHNMYSLNSLFYMVNSAEEYPEEIIEDIINRPFFRNDVNGNYIVLTSDSPYKSKKP